VTRDDAAKLFDLLASEFSDLEITLRKEAGAATDDNYAVEVGLNLPLGLSDLERLVSLIHHPGDSIPGRVEHEGRVCVRVEREEVRLWIAVTSKNGEDAKGASAV